jgi:hypothetical protein
VHPSVIPAAASASISRKNWCEDGTSVKEATAGAGEICRFHQISAPRKPSVSQLAGNA